MEITTRILQLLEERDEMVFVELLYALRNEQAFGPCLFNEQSQFLQRKLRMLQKYGLIECPYEGCYKACQKREM